jgi:transposase
MREALACWPRLDFEAFTGLASAGRAGLLPRLTQAQLAQVEAVLVAGPRASWYPTQRWSPHPVAEVMEAVTAVCYGQTQTWTILRARLGWTRQRPARRAIERDDAAIAT